MALKGQGTFAKTDPTLTALSEVTTAADKLIYATDSDTFSTCDLTSAARSLLDDTTTAAMRDTLAAEAKTNLIINGDFSVAQRGTSYTSETWRPNSDDSYLLDRWLLLSDGNDIVDVSQVSGAFSRSRYAMRAEVETANKKFGFCQIIEANACIPLRGQKISVSFAAKTVNAKLVENIRVAVLEWTSTADAVTSDVVSAWGNEGTNPTFATNWTALNTPANLALTTSEQTFKVENLTVGASCNNLAVFIWVDDTDCAVDDILQLGEVQVVRGSVVPEFAANDDLVQCLRRYQVLPVHTGWGNATTWSRIYIGYLLPMATTPTSTAIIQVWTGSAWVDPTELFYRTSDRAVVLAIEYNSHVFVGHGASQYPNLFESGIIRLEAEL